MYLPPASKVCLPGGELEHSHVTSSPARELAVDLPSFLWFKNYSFVFRGVSQHEAPSWTLMWLWGSFFLTLSPVSRCCRNQQHRRTWGFILFSVSFSWGQKDRAGVTLWPNLMNFIFKSIVWQALQTQFTQRGAHWVTLMSPQATSDTPNTDNTTEHLCCRPRGQFLMLMERRRRNLNIVEDAPDVQLFSHGL